ncbi:PAS domain S-box-containing protein [Paucidesulfovibrio gracilis DSM 16080]|uniref:PAS domain S-box-containing protein n=1 Tax=Paucidesulfovibrio gracilis DSM 16080 TaxID=1121449 RepID=A0A1T4XJT7_9BACT|nr:sigma 54-interacting transcriptional regulator [Paucidesulfovibrio gracilis]SKA89746.1 PAS domain S-box-containing protein [Paucidesulfovibrio gracilis DSM 16080]
MGAQIVLTDYHADTGAQLARALTQCGQRVRTAPRLDTAAHCGPRTPDLVFCPALPLERLQHISRFTAAFPTVPLLLTTATPGTKYTEQAMRAGAFHVLPWPAPPETLPPLLQLAQNHAAVLRERERLLEERQEQEHNLHGLLEAVTESLLLVRRGGTILYANQVLADRLGLPLAELKDTNVDDLGMNPEITAYRRKQADQAYASGQAVRFEDEHRGRRFAISYYPLARADGSYDRLAVYAQDITKTHSAVQEKERVLGDLKAAFRSISEAIVTLDRDLKVRRVNEAALQWPGGPGFRRGRDLTTSDHPLARICVQLARTVLATSGPVRDHRRELSRREREGGQGRVVTINASPLLDEAGQNLGAVLVLRDITRITQLEQRLGERGEFHGMVGSGPAMRRIFDAVQQVGPVDSTVLITGESGTGKELVAEAIHAQSPRHHGPLVKVNCAALSENLLNAELFGHVRGAFTGAIRHRAGRIETARNGTLFLDEIGDISPGTQRHLLRFLESREYERLGESRTRRADVRVVAATNTDLAARVSQGLFRADLYYRLKVMELRLPPLRERTEDIPTLAHTFAQRFSHRFQKHVHGLDDGALRALQGHSWPGNVRELRHALEHACALCTESTLRAGDLPQDILSGKAPLSDHTPRDNARERRRILDTLKKNHWNKSTAARMLGISRTTLYKRLRDYGIST